MTKDIEDVPASFPVTFLDVDAATLSRERATDLPTGAWASYLRRTLPSLDPEDG